MRDFFIALSEKILGVFLVLMILGVFAAGAVAASAPQVQGGGPLAGLAVIVLGLLYVVIMGGMLYLFFGIYRNTQRTNALLEDLLKK